MPTLDFTNVFPSVLNWATVGLMAATFIAFWKFIFGMYNVPGLSTFFAGL